MIQEIMYNLHVERTGYQYPLDEQDSADIANLKLLGFEFADDHSIPDYPVSCRITSGPKTIIFTSLAEFDAFAAKLESFGFDIYISHCNLTIVNQIMG